MVSLRLGVGDWRLGEVGVDAPGGKASVWSMGKASGMAVSWQSLGMFERKLNAQMQQALPFI
jgi:hypothetical protein